MFNLIGLPLTDITQIKNANFLLPIASLTNNNKAIPTLTIQSNSVETKVNQTSKEPYNTTVNLNTVSNGSEIINLPIKDNNLYQIQDIEIYGKKYIRSFESNLTEGTFNIDSITNTIQIYLKPNNYNTTTPIKINGSKKKLVTNEIIDIPSFISDYNLVGNISISRGFQDHPSCTFSLVVDSTSINDIELLFNAHKYSNLFNQKFVLFDIPFRIRSFSKNVSKYNESLGEHKIQINFEGWYRYLIDKSIKIRPGSDNVGNDNNFVECNINTNNKPKTVTIGSNTDANKIRIGLAQLAGNAGLTYNGSSYYFEIDKNTPNDAVTTFSSELNKILPSKSEFPIYSIDSGIYTKKWNNVNSFQIDESDILSECPVNYNAELVTYAPGILTWKDNSKNNTTDNSEDSYKNKAPEFEYKPPKRSTVITGDSNPTVPPANLQSIQTLDMNYDQSGEKKIQITTVYEGSTVISEITKTYGLAFTANNIYSNGKLFGGAATFWKLVEEINIDHLYDNYTGYYLGNNVTGKKLVRFMQETDALESVIFATSTDAVEKAKLQAMQFRYIPITGHTRYLLRQHKDYYKDQAFKHPYIIYPWCTSTGKLTYLKVKDPTYADDMFVGVEETYKHCFASLPNPENLADPEIKLPVLTTGEISYNLVKTSICASKSVYSGGTLALTDPIVGSDFDNPEERYITYTKQYSAQDSNFTNSLEEANSSISTGRPSVASRRPSAYVAVSDDKLDPLQLNTLSGGSITTKLRETKVNNADSNTNETQYVVYSTPYNNNSPVTGSYSFEYAESLSEALEAVRTQLNIQKTQQEVTLNITTLFNSYLLEGSKYSFIYLDVLYNCRILSISHTLDVQGINEFGELVVTGNSSLQLGVEQYCVINNYTKLIKNNGAGDNNTPSANTIDISYPHYIGKILGTLVDIAATYPISRGNFK